MDRRYTEVEACETALSVFRKVALKTGPITRDLVARELGLWAIEPLTRIDEWLPDEWPGCRIELWGDQYQEHIARCAVQVKDWDFGAGLETLAKRLEVAPPYANTHAKPEELERAREVIASLRGNRRNH